VYPALGYNFGLSAISGIALLIISPGSEFVAMFKLTHVIAAIFIILILIFHFLINVRHHDAIALRCNFITGTLPLGYVKKHHKIWYKAVYKHERILARSEFKQRRWLKSSDPIADAFMKMYAIEGLAISVEDAERYAKRFKETSSQKDIKKFMEISKNI
jgi:hypothetical protein